MQESGEIRHIVLVGCLVRHDIDVMQSRKKRTTIGYFSLNEIDTRGNIVWPAVRMDFRLETIQGELHPLVEILYIVPAGDLPETRYARFHRKLLLLIFSKTGVLTDEGGSGTDQTHVAFEHAVKLGKFIQAVATHPIAESGYAGIVRQFKYWAPHLIERFQLIFQLVGIEAHGAKLIPHEGNASLTNNLPSVERRPARRQFDSRCQCQK